MDTGQLMRLSSLKRCHSGNPISQYFDFDLTCDVIGDLEAKFHIAVSEFVYVRSSHMMFEF